MLNMVLVDSPTIWVSAAIIIIVIYGTSRLTHYLGQGEALQVQQDAAGLQAGPQLKQAVEGQGGDVGLAPALPSLLHLLLKLHPPRRGSI